jgi:hypothetical protein
VLGVWQQPFWEVKLQLLPLEQQQDPTSLQASLARLKQQHKATWGDDSWVGTDSAAAGSVGERAEAGSSEKKSGEVAGGDSAREGMQGAEEEGARGAVKRSTFGDAANLLLFARLVPYEGGESSSSDDDESFSSDDDEGSFESMVFE